MKCARCNAELPDSAALCYNCGSPVQKDRANVFSYLPEGTPPWPTSAPEKVSMATIATSTATKADAPTSRGRRSTRSTLTMLALLLLTPIIGIGATLGILYANGQFPPNTAPQVSVSVPTVTPSTPTAAAAAQATITAPTSFQQSRNTDLNLAYKYPADWQVDPIQKSTNYTVIILHSPTTYNITMYLVRFAATASASFNTNNDVNTSDMQSLTSQGITVQQVQSAKTQQQISGLAWDELDGSYVNPSDNTTMRIISITGKHAKEYYHVLIILPEIYYTSALQEYFTPMLSGIQFIA